MKRITERRTLVVDGYHGKSVDINKMKYDLDISQKETDQGDSYVVLVAEMDELTSFAYSNGWSSDGPMIALRHQSDMAGVPVVADLVLLQPMTKTTMQPYI